MICPCQKTMQSPIQYDDCCARYHAGEHPETCEQLMRSRYSAYTLNLNQYLLDTWHPSTRPDTLNVTNGDTWIKLEIVSSSKNKVHFKAYYLDVHNDNKKVIACLDETSTFSQENGFWQYVDGNAQIIENKIGRNDSCYCGSGRKVKKCCGID